MAEVELMLSDLKLDLNVYLNEEGIKFLQAIENSQHPTEDKFRKEFLEHALKRGYLEKSQEFGYIPTPRGTIRAETIIKMVFDADSNVNGKLYSGSEIVSEYGKKMAKLRETLLGR
jgi:hypothetical protein